MENVLCWFCGFVTPYLILRAIRGMWTTVGCLLLILPLTAEATIHCTLHVCNNTGTVVYFKGISSDCSCQSVAGGPINGGACNNWTDGGSNPYTYQIYWYDNAGLTHQIGGPDAYAVTVDYGTINVTWNGGIVFTNYTYSLSITNTNQFSSVFFAVAKTNGVPYATNVFELAPGQVWTNSITGTNYLGSWDIFQPGSLTNDYKPTLVTTINPTTTTGGTPDPTSNTKSTSGSGPTSDQALQARTEGALDQIDKDLNEMSDLLDWDLEQIYSKIPTNQPTSTPIDYSQMLTNILEATKQAAYGPTDGQNGTNLASQMFTALSNMTQQAVGYWTNAYNSNALGQAEIGGLNGASNQMANGWAYGGTGASSAGPLDMVFGTAEIGYYTLTLDPFSSSLASQPSWLRTARDNLIACCHWVRTWLNAVVIFAMWWIMYQQLQEWYKQMQNTANIVSKPAKFDWKEWSGKLIFGIALQLFIIGLMMSFPTMIVAAIDGYSYSSGLPSVMGQGFSQDLHTSGPDGGGPIAAIMARGYDIMCETLPLPTLWTAAGNMVLFLLLGYRLLNVALGSLRAAGFGLGACLLFCFIERAEATEVVLQNYTGTNIVITNDVEVITLPPGTHTSNLQPGDWTWGTNGGFTLAASDNEKAIIRFEGTSTNTANLLTNTARTPQSAFIQGFGVGWFVFGMVWIVSYVRKGLKVGTQWNSGV